MGYCFKIALKSQILLKYIDDMTCMAMQISMKSVSFDC